MKRIFGLFFLLLTPLATFAVEGGQVMYLGDTVGGFEGRCLGQAGH
jgi:hypothetical protein